MSPSSEVSAAAASDAYTDRPAIDFNKPPKVSLNGHEYFIFGYKDDPVTGFHATAYRSKDTGEVIIAYRGTDPNFKHHTRTTVQDALVDAAMVKDKINPQKDAADAFTQEVLNKAQSLGIPKDQITVAGHSLGGTLAEIEAQKFGLRGATFNGYGSVDLRYGISPGGHQVTNYVMAGDVVSAASRHFGEVKVLASQADIDGLHAGRYLGAAPGAPPPNPLLTMSLGDHSVMHFTGEGGMENVLAPANIGQYEARYAQHQAAFDHFRGDLQQDRAELATAIHRADSRNIETTLANLPPHLQQQLAEYHALHVDVPIQQAVERNAAVRGAESGLGYMASETRVAGQAEQGMDERLAVTARQAGHDVVYVAPGAALTAEVFAEGAHLHGQATHAASEFAAGQWQSARHAVEQGAHLAGQVDTKVVHVAEASLVSGIDAVTDTYQSTRADVQALSHAAIEGAQRVEKGAAQTYNYAKHAVSQGIQATEHAASETYDMLTHPEHGVGRTAAPSVPARENPSAAPMTPHAQAVAPTGHGYALDDPRHASNPHNELYNELHERIPEASENRLLQLTAACHQKGITAQNLESVYINHDINAVVIASGGLTPAIIAVDVSQPSPQPQQTIQQIQHFDQAQQALNAGIQQAIQQQNMQGPQGPSMGR